FGRRQQLLGLEIEKRGQEVADVVGRMTDAYAIHVDQREATLVQEHVFRTEGAMQQHGRRLVVPIEGKAPVETGTEPRKRGRKVPLDLSGDVTHLVKLFARRDAPPDDVRQLMKASQQSAGCPHRLTEIDLPKGA